MIKITRLFCVEECHKKTQGSPRRSCHERGARLEGGIRCSTCATRQPWPQANLQDELGLTASVASDACSGSEDRPTSSGGARERMRSYLLGWLPVVEAQQPLLAEVAWQRRFLHWNSHLH